MMCGRLGALSGNLLFPVFVEIGCVPPFVMVASMMLRKLNYCHEYTYIYLPIIILLTVAAVLSIFVPNPKKAAFN